MRVLITLLMFISLIGCVSAPYRDDHTAHINTIPEQYDASELRFVLVDGPAIDIRGVYSADNTTVSSSIMYQGVGGIAGLLAQIGTHASLINSQRNTKLADAQMRANEEISLLISLAPEIDLRKLVKEAGYKLEGHNHTEVSSTLVNIKPIFFASKTMDKISLNMITWVDGNGGAEGSKPQYQNLVQVFSQNLSDQQKARLEKGDKQFLSNLMLMLLDTSLTIVTADLAGKYSSIDTPDKTFLVEKHFGKKVVRGTVVDNMCNYIVIRDLRSWFVAHMEQSISVNGNAPEEGQKRCSSMVKNETAKL